MKRAGGILMHISSLPGDYSVGSFGKEARDFIDFLAECGFSKWQVLPFNMADECGSPYKSFGAFSGNPYFIDLPTLLKKGLLTKEELEGAKQSTPYAAEFERLGKERIPLLKMAAARAKNTDEVEAWMKENPHVADFCTFMALKEANGGREWTEFTLSVPDEETLFAWKWIEYEFFAEWRDLHAYAKEKGIGVIGDVPIYVAYDSSDVYFGRENFLLDEDGKPTAVAGVPPDYFSADGQLWGNPLYDWEKMKGDGFAFWKDRMRFMLSLFDGVRIDHFRGLESYFSIPYGAKTAREGKWVKGPGMPFVKEMRAIAGDSLIIAEDLGDITPEVAELVKKSGFPGMRVLQFAFLGDGDSPHLPYRYPENCVAYTGTHDNNTLLGHIWETDPESRRKAAVYAGCEDENWNILCASLIREMMASHAGLTVFPIQDIFCFGADTRMNVPGKAEGNWRYRITCEQLAAVDKARYRSLLTLFGRI